MAAPYSVHYYFTVRARKWARVALPGDMYFEGAAADVRKVLLEGAVDDVNFAIKWGRKYGLTLVPGMWRSLFYPHEFADENGTVNFYVIEGSFSYLNKKKGPERLQKLADEAQRRGYTIRSPAEWVDESTYYEFEDTNGNIVEIAYCDLFQRPSFSVPKYWQNPQADGIYISKIPYVPEEEKVEKAKEQGKEWVPLTLAGLPFERSRNGTTFEFTLPDKSVVTAPLQKMEDAVDAIIEQKVVEGRGDVEKIEVGDCVNLRLYLVNH